jgi:hypothetical protein
MKSQYKEFLQSILRAYLEYGEQGSPDIITGKGKGIKILLHGESGIGKTLTAGKFYFSIILPHPI